MCKKKQDIWANVFNSFKNIPQKNLKNIFFDPGAFSDNQFFLPGLLNDVYIQLILELNLFLENIILYVLKILKGVFLGRTVH